MRTIRLPFVTADSGKSFCLNIKGSELLNKYVAPQ